MRDYQTKSNVGSVADSISATRFGAGEFNSIAAELENAVTSSDQTLATADGTGEVSNQLAMSLATYGAGGGFYEDSGAADAYVLDPISPRVSPPDYFDGFTISFKPTNANTGASTVNVASIGVKDITTIDGTDLTAGDIDTDSFSTIIFNSGDDRFELQSNLYKITNQLGGRKNHWDNGNCLIAQYNTSQSTAGKLSLDRYNFQGIDAASQVAISGIPGVVNGFQFGNTAAASPYFHHSTLGQNSNNLVGKVVTLSFWARVVSGASALQIEQYYPTSTLNDFSVTTLHDTLQVWTTGAGPGSLTRYSFTFTVPSGCIYGLRHLFNLNDGTANNYVEICGIQLEINPYASDFEVRSFDQTLRDCYPYLQKSFNYSVAVGSISSPNAVSRFAITSTVNQSGFDYESRLITTPSVILYSPITGTANRIRNGSTASDQIVSSSTGNESRVSLIVLTTATTLSDQVSFHWVADTGF